MRIIILPSYDNTTWFRILGSTVSEGYHRHITFDDLGNPVFAGRVIADTTSDNNHDIQVTKYTVDGTLTWQYSLKSLTDPFDDDRGYGITRDPAGNLYLSGQRVENPDAILGRSEAWGSVVKLPSNGSSVTWQQEVLGLQPVGGSNNNDARINEVEYANTSSHVYAVGTLEDEEGTDRGEKALIVAKYPDTGGSPTWLQGFSDNPTGGSDTGHDHEGLGLVLDSSDNVYACGIDDNETAGYQAGLLVKYDSSGVFQWGIHLVPTGGAGYVIQLEHIRLNAAEDRAYCVGRYRDPTTPQQWLVLVKFSGLSTTPAVDWAIGYGVTSPDSSSFYGECLDVDSSERIHVAGHATGTALGIEAGIVAEFDSTGALVWDGIFGAAEGGDYHDIYSVRKRGSSLFIAGRSSIGFGTLNTGNAWAGRIDASGGGRDAGSYGTLEYYTGGYGTFNLMTSDATAATPVPGMSSYTPASVRHRAGGLVHGATAYTEVTIP